MVVNNDSLRAIMAMNKLGNAELSEKSGVAKSTIARMIRGDSVSVSSVGRIAAALNVSVDDLISERIKTKSIVTYSDVFQNIVFFVDKMRASVEFKRMGGTDALASITFKNDPVMTTFIKEYGKMKVLVDKGQLNRYVLDLWLKDLMKKYEGRNIK